MLITPEPQDHESRTFMIKRDDTTRAPARAEQLYALAGQAENLAALASLADAQIARACADLVTLASAAKRLANEIEKAADGEAVHL